MEMHPEVTRHLIEPRYKNPAAILENQRPAVFLFQGPFTAGTVPVCKSFVSVIEREEGGGPMTNGC